MVQQVFNNSDSRVTLASIMTKMMHQVLLIFPKGRLCMFESNTEHFNSLMKAHMSLVRNIRKIPIMTLIQKNSEFAYCHWTHSVRSTIMPPRTLLIPTFLSSIRSIKNCSYLYLHAHKTFCYQFAVSKSKKMHVVNEGNLVWNF